MFYQLVIVREEDETVPSSILILDVCPEQLLIKRPGTTGKTFHEGMKSFPRGYTSQEVADYICAQLGEYPPKLIPLLDALSRMH